jgi:hypothetical protein
LGFIYDAGGKLWTKPLASITKEELEKEVQKYLIEHADEIITQITYNLAEALEERTYVAGIMDTVKLIDAEKVQNAIKYSISTAISLLEQIDINEQTTDMQTSIISGHQVIVMAHSQGNFFMNKVYEGIKFNNPWMTNYIKTIAIASPANSIPDPSTPIITYDNDPITLIPDIAGSFIINPIRYYSIIPQLEYEAMYDGRTLPCISDKYMRGDGNIERCVNEHHLQTVENTNRDFHFFEYYMSPSAALGEETRTNPAYIEIMNFLLKSIRDFKTAPSQWNLTFKSFYDQWTCVDKLAKGSHKYQSTIDTYMQPNYIFTFDSNGKIYQVDGLYVKSSNYNGSKIVNGDNESVHIDTSCSDAKYGVIICGSGDGNGYCYQFKDKQDNTIGSIAGFGGGGGRIDWSIKQIRDIL